MDTPSSLGNPALAILFRYSAEVVLPLVDDVPGLPSVTVTLPMAEGFTILAAFPCAKVSLACRRSLCSLSAPFQEDYVMLPTSMAPTGTVN